MGRLACDETDRANTLSAETFRKIRSDIIATRLAPGEKLRVAQLKKRYGAGASPLREALSRLVAEGFVATEDRRGYWVSPLSPEEYIDLTQTRAVVEAHALRQSIRHGDTEWEGSVAGAYHQLMRVEDRLAMDPPTFTAAWRELDQRFHEALIAACPLRWLRHFARVLLDHHARYHGVPPIALYSASAFDDHRRIMEAALDRDAERAVALLGEHVHRNIAAGFVDTLPPSRRQ